MIVDLKCINLYGLFYNIIYIYSYETTLYQTIIANSNGLI